MPCLPRSRPARASDGDFIASTRGQFGPGFGGSICGPLRSNVAGGSISALATFGCGCPIYPALVLPAGSIDGSTSGGSIGPTHEIRPQPDASLRLSFPSTVSGDFCLSSKAAGLQFIPLRRSLSSLRCYGAVLDPKAYVLRSTLRASWRSASSRHAPSAFLSTAFRYVLASEVPGRSLELHRRFLESIGDQLDTVPGILSCKSLRSFDPVGERI